MSQAIAGGLVSGSVYALLGLGIVLVFSVSRFVNLAQGEFYVVGALTTSTLIAAGMPVAVAAGLGILAVGLLAAVIDRIVFVRLADAPHASQLLGGIGVALSLAGAARLLWGADERSLPPFVDAASWRVFGARVSIQALFVVGTLAVGCAVLWFLLNRTFLGTSMRAVAALSSRARILGIDVRSVTTISFAIAGAFGAAAGVVVTPLVFTSYHSGLLLTISGFIAAAFGGLRSVRGAVAGGLLLGLLEAFTVYFGQSALKTPISLSLLIVVLVYRSALDGGRPALAVWWRGLRSSGGARAALPAVSGRGWSLDPRHHYSWVGVAAVVAFAALGPTLWGPYWLSVWSFIGVFVIVGIGLDLLLGFTGQLSLGQTSFMGMAAYLVALTTEWWGVGSWTAVALAIGGTVVIAGAVGAVVLRLRGYYFTLATLAFALAAEALVNGLPEQLGGPSGVVVSGSLAIGGTPLDTPTALFVVIWLVVASSIGAALRLTRSRFGYAMRATGYDEDLSAASGIAPFSVKLRVFVVSSLLAAVAGVLYAHLLRFVSPPTLGFTGGLDAVVGLLLGGFGTIWGALIGIPAIRLLPELGARFDDYQLLIYGASIVGIVILLPEGIVGGLRRLAGVVAIGSGRASREADVTERPSQEESHRGLAPHRREPVLQATDIGKRFGGLEALSGVDLVACPGQIVGLIGPNGAGKSTLLSVLAGGIRPTTGTVEVDGNDVTASSATTRARIGVARTFQLPRVPGSMTVAEVVAIGTQRRGSAGLVRGVLGGSVRAQRAAYDAAREALELTGLDHLHGTPAIHLSTGEQKLLELARALAADPRVLLTDEPAGGLFEDDLPRLAGVLRRLAQRGMAVVLVEHEMRLVMEVCDEIVVLSDGRVIASGTPEHVRGDQEVLDAYLGA